MAGNTLSDDFLRDNYSPKSFDDPTGDLKISNPDHDFVPSFTSFPPNTQTTTTHPQDAFVTAPPYPLEPRQNSPQDCSNLINASVDRATVEISRTIIALNATFSQQLQEVSISASSGIKSAQDSASSVVDVISQSASAATSSAFSSVDIARSAATSANLAFASISAASISEVDRLSSSLSFVQASASFASAAAQLVIASQTTQSAIAAETFLSTIAPTEQGQSSQSLQPGGIILLTVGQAVAAIIGIMLVSMLLTIATYFLVSKLRKEEGNSYPKGMDFAGTANKPPTQMSTAFGARNAMRVSVQTGTEEGNVRDSPVTLSVTRSPASDNSYKKKESSPRLSIASSIYSQPDRITSRDAAVPASNRTRQPRTFYLSADSSQFSQARYSNFAATNPTKEGQYDSIAFDVDFDFLSMVLAAEERMESPIVPGNQEPPKENPKELTEEVIENSAQKASWQPVATLMEEPLKKIPQGW